ncbi:mucin-19 isoform X9 [Anastrepha ludens]|uniref:mucin-19 isoform X9 n=1 Tax=Anastrepha ludens TaxID=28586 RepID=UPI0023B1B36B|nr:mucin-19 isoform X9 [Anastrepha ludens]
MEVIKPMDFSSFSAFCEHLDKSTKKTTSATTATITTTTTAIIESTTANGVAGASDTSTTPPPISNLINGNANNHHQYFEKMERQGKMELAAKERESQRLLQIPKKWNRREEYEFLRVLTGYGVDLQPPTALGIILAPDWTKFKQMAHLERKSDETLSDYYKVFIAMCKRKAGIKLNDNERGLEGIIEEISEDHAKLILERLELLSKLREVARHPQLEERLKLCQMNADTPDWWEPGKHDKEIISAVLKHGLYRSETFIFNDPSFSFAESEKRFIRELEAQIQRSIKLESFNADRLPSAVPTVKGEVIDLDDELLTKDSLIKKEQFTSVKAEVKTEKSVDVADKLTSDKGKTDTEPCAVSEELSDKKTDRQNESNEDLSLRNASTVNKEPTGLGLMNESNTEGKDSNLIHEIPNFDTKSTNLSSIDKSDEGVSSKELSEIDAEQIVEKKPKDGSEKMDVSESAVEKKDLDAGIAVVDNEKSKELSAYNDADKVGEKIPTAEKSEVASKINGTPTDELESNVEKESCEDAKLTCPANESDKNKSDESEDEVVTKKNELSKGSELSSKEDSESTKPNAEESISKDGSAVADAADENPKSTADEEILDLAVATTGATDPDDEDVMKEKEKAVEEECKKQAAELKARFPDLEVIQPSTVKQKQDKPKLEMCMIRWFKDFALERRIAHIVICVETNKWTVNRNYTAFAGCKGIDLNICLHEAIPHLKNIERPPSTPDVITITTELGVTKHLQTSQMPQVAGTVPASPLPVTAPPAVSTNIALGLLPPPTTVAGVNSSGKGISNMSVPPLDANSINAAVAAAVAAAAAGGNNSNSLSANTLSALLPGMTMTPASAAATTALNATAPVAQPVNMPNSVPAPLPPATQSIGKKRKRHIAIDVETERAKLHALLNSSQNMGLKDWETEIANMEPLAATAQPSGRRSASSVSPAAPTASATSMPLQPPPAHQHASLARQSSGQFSKPAVPPLKTPPTSISGPMDLSSSLPRMNMTDMLKSASNVSGAIDLSEVQDFSMPSKKSSTSHLQASLSSAFPSMGGKGKLDDTLNKLMKKNNCTIEEPVIGKEKKRKKLDEIVLGLSAAKEQKTFPDPSLPSSKKPQIPPSVSVTPASLPTSVSNQNQQNQKPFTITVTTVPGKSKSGGNVSMPSPAPVPSTSSSGLPLMSGSLSLKDINAIVAQTMASDPQTLLKQQQKMMQCLPPAQRKAYEAMLAEMEQAMKLSAKYNVPDLKVNKWLTDMTTPLTDQLNMDFGNSAASTSTNTNSRRSNRQQSSNSAHQASVSQMNKAAGSQSAQSHAQHQQQATMAGPQGLTGEEPVPVVNKQTGKRISGSKAPQLKRLMQWLTENPAYEVDPKWLEQIQNPMSIPSPKLSSMDTSNYASTSKSSHGGRPSSTSSSSSSGAHAQQQQSSSTQSSPAPSPTVSSKKSSRQSAIDQANAAMQFGTLAGLNPNILASLPGLGTFDPKNPLGAFDPKNPLLSMPFAGMPAMGNIPGLNNLNSMNLFASLASMGGLGNLATMDPQTLATLMAAGSALAGLGGTNTNTGNSGTGKNSQSGGSSSKKNKNDAQQNAMNLGALAGNSGNSGNSGSSIGGSSNKNANAAAAAASQLTGCFPYLFPNPSLLYPPMGLGSLNPYSLGSSGLGSAYDQLAQQYNLLNGGAGVTSSAGSSSTTQSKSHQSQSKSSNSRSSTSSSSSAASVANLMNVMASMGTAGQPPTSVSSSQSSSRSSGRQSAASRAAAQVAEMAQLSSLLLPGTDPHLLESLSRMDLAQSTRLLSSLGIPQINAPSPQSSSSDKRSSNNNSAASIAAAQAAQAEKQAAKEQQKWMESLARSQLPTDLATLQAFSQGKFPASLTGGSQTTSTSSSASTSSASSSKNASKAAAAALAAQLPQILGLPSDFAPAMIADMAQALTAPGSLASLAGLTAPPTSSASSMGGGSGSSSSTSSSSKRQRGGAGGGGGSSSNMIDPDALTKDAFKQQMEYYTKTLGLGSGISLIPTSVATSMSTSGVSNSISNAQIDDHHKSKRPRIDSHAAALASAKDELSAAMLASGLPLNLGGGMTSIEKSLRSVNVGMGGMGGSGGGGGAAMPEADKVTLTPLNSAGIAANLPSQTTITIAPPISSGASSSSERSERSESRISLTITNAADAAKLPPPYEEADELIIQPILKKPQNTPTSTVPSVASSSHGSVEDLESAVAASMAGGGGGGGVTSGNTTPTPSTSAAAAAAAAAASANEEHRRSSSRLKRPRTVTDHSLNEQPPEKRRELRSTRHTRQSSGSLEATLNLSTNSEAEEKNE